eukprot:1158357-Pelagomonas_calceolata.AAC.4
MQGRAAGDELLWGAVGLRWWRQRFVTDLTSRQRVVGSSMPMACEGEQTTRRPAVGVAQHCWVLLAGNACCGPGVQVTLGGEGFSKSR